VVPWQDLPAIAAHDLFRVEAGKFLRRAVERRDGPPLVDDEQTPVQVLKHGAGFYPETEIGPVRPGFGQDIIVESQHRPDNFPVLAIEGGHGIFQEPHLLGGEQNLGQELGAQDARVQGFL
jgi:hypothetical protein